MPTGAAAGRGACSVLAVPSVAVPDDVLLRRIRSAREGLATRGPRSQRGAGDFERVGLPDWDTSVLRDLLVAEFPEVVVEVGLAYGSSALAIAEALASAGRPKPRHVIIDAYQDHYADAGWDLLVSTGLTEICSLMRERSQLVLPRLVAEEMVADAAFVDGSHIFHNVFVDLYFLREIVKPGGLVVLDDCNLPSVGTAVRYFELNTGWRMVDITERTRLRAYRLPDPPEEPSYQQFTAFSTVPS
jgi:predicted O-methyltransferase YrrM